MSDNLGLKEANENKKKSCFMDRKQRGQTRIQDEFVNKKLKRFIEYLIFHKISVMNKINYQVSSFCMELGPYLLSCY